MDIWRELINSRQQAVTVETMNEDMNAETPLPKKLGKKLWISSPLYMLRQQKSISKLNMLFLNFFSFFLCSHNKTQKKKKKKKKKKEKCLPHEKKSRGRIEL